MQVDVEQAGSAGLLGDYVVVPDFFDYGARFHMVLLDKPEACPTAFDTASPTAEVLADPFRSAVTLPEFSTASTAALTAAASSFKPKLYSSMAATDPIAPKGLALFFPAISGAEPCTGSY